MESFEIVVLHRSETEPFRMGEQVYLVATDADGDALKDIQGAVAGRYERQADGHFARVCERPAAAKPCPR
jgi:hypothetical protein